MDLIGPDSIRLLLYPWLRLTWPDLQPPIPAEDYDENRQAWGISFTPARARRERGP